jgi:hypothetical protein
VKHAGARVSDLGSFLHLVRSGRGEYFASTCGIEHPKANEPTVERFVTCATTGDQGNFAGAGGFCTVNHSANVVDFKLGVRGVDSGKRIGEYRLWGVD